MKELLARIAALLERIVRALEGGFGSVSAGPYEPPVDPSAQHQSSHFSSGLRYPEVRKFVVEKRQEGWSYKEIVAGIQEQWADDPTKWAGKSAVARFWDRARRGRLREYGIKV